MSVRVWDLPLRLFHWLLVMSVGAAWLTAELSEDWGSSAIEIHAKIGLFILGLVVFRLVWGLMGSTYARFANFFPTPNRLKSYLAGDYHTVGHNPLGAISVLALLCLLLAQSLSGLFANDDIMFKGPLAVLVSTGISNQLTKFHHLIFDLLSMLIALHIAAILFYVRIKKINLLKPMVTGYREHGEGQSARGGGVAALLCALFIAAGAVYAASGVWLPAPAPKPELSVPPSW